MTDNDRPQDVGRRHARSAPNTARNGTGDALIERWQRVERETLERVTIRLEGVDKGTGLDGEPLPREYPSNAETAALIDLGVKIARDLGSAIDPTPAPVVVPPKPRRGRGKLDV